MEGIDIDGIIKAASDPKLTSNMDSLLEGMGEIQKVMDRVEKLMATVDRLGFKPLLVRAAGQKLNIDAESPLVSEKICFVPASEYHEKVFSELNTLPEEAIAQILVGGIGSAKPKEAENAAPDDKPTEPNHRE